MRKDLQTTEVAAHLAINWNRRKQRREMTFGPSRNKVHRRTCSQPPSRQQRHSHTIKAARTLQPHRPTGDHSRIAKILWICITAERYRPALFRQFSKMWNSKFYSFGFGNWREKMKEKYEVKSTEYIRFQTCVSFSNVDSMGDRISCIQISSSIIEFPFDIRYARWCLNLSLSGIWFRYSKLIYLATYSILHLRVT